MTLGLVPVRHVPEHSVALSAPLCLIGVSAGWCVGLGTVWPTEGHRDFRSLCETSQRPDLTLLLNLTQDLTLLLNLTQVQLY